MEWFKTQLVKILAIFCVLQTAAIIALLLGKGIHIDRHVENHQHQEQYQGQVSLTVIPDHIEATGNMPYSKVCIGDQGYKSIEEILSNISPTQLIFKDVDYVHGCVSVPNFYKMKKK